MRHEKRRKKMLLSLLDDAYNLTVNLDIARFLETYIDCEISAMKLIHYYKVDHHKKEPDFLFLPNVYKVCAYFSLDFSVPTARMLFSGGEGRRGEKTPRQLRNAYVHKKSVADCEEILNNMESHMSLMEQWLKAVNDLI